MSQRAAPTGDGRRCARWRCSPWRGRSRRRPARARTPTRRRRRASCAARATPRPTTTSPASPRSPGRRRRQAVGAGAGHRRRRRGRDRAPPTAARWSTRAAARTLRTVSAGPALVVEPTARDLPAPDRTWELSTGGARTVAGRPATVVVAHASRRHAGATAVRRRRHRPAARPSGRSGRTGRSSARCGFPTIDVGDATPRRSRRRRRDDRAPPRSSSSVPDGYRAPRLARGFRVGDALAPPRRRAALLQRRRLHRVGVRAAGRSRLGRAPDGGTDTQLADTRTRTYHEASGDVAVWERNGLVYTCVTDAPSDVFENMVGAARVRRSQHPRGRRRLRARPVRLGLTRTDANATNRRHQRGV